MTGLVFVEELDISLFQWGVLLAVTGFYCAGMLTLQKTVFCQLLLLAGFFNTPLSIDVRLLFRESAYLHQFGWKAFLSEFAFRDYVKLQPPFYTFWVSRFPIFWVHQIVVTGISISIVCLMKDMYGEQVKYILACPLWGLMSTQPSNDFMLFACIVLCLRAISLNHKMIAALLFGLTYMLKPLVVLLLPFMVWRLGSTLPGSVVIWGTYLRWSLDYFFGVMQWSFLLRQLCLDFFIK